MPTTLKDDRQAIQRSVESRMSALSLEVLFLTATDITDEGVETIAGSKSLGELTRLGLARNDDVTPEGLRAIAKSKNLRRLRWLEFSDEDGLQQVVTRSRR